MALEWWLFDAFNISTPVLIQASRSHSLMDKVNSVDIGIFKEFDPDVPEKTRFQRFNPSQLSLI